VKIFFSKQAEKYIRALPNRVALRVIDGIDHLPEGDVKPLSGRKGEYRLRIGKFRVLFFIEGETIRVFKVDTRGDSYK
jgi:mRNA interferase RelE/StbE